jgi:hypothetical protein
MKRREAMKAICKVVTALGGIFLAALLIAALAPKATRGIAAALVQITNTAGSPAITQGVSSLASQNVEIFCALTFNSTAALCINRLAPTDTTNYQVPAGQNFVVTDAEFLTLGGGSGDCSVALQPPSPGVSIDLFNFAGDGHTHQVLFPTGLLFPAGYEFNNANVGMTNCNAMWFRGYVTPN